MTRRSGPKTSSAPILCSASVLDGGFQGGRGLDGDNVAALGGQNGLHGHGRLPDRRSSTQRSTGRFITIDFGTEFLRAGQCAASGKRYSRSRANSYSRRRRGAECSSQLCITRGAALPTPQIPPLAVRSRVPGGNGPSSCRSSGWRERNGIERGKAEETGQEPADMRLPGDRLLDPGDADRATPNRS